MQEATGAVEYIDVSSSPDDAAQGLTEQKTPERTGASLEELLTDEDGGDGEGAAASGKEGKQNGEPPSREPGWIKKRVDTAVQREVSKAVADATSRVRQEYEARMAPLMEQAYAQQARQLVADGEIKDEQRALEYVRLKSGQGMSASEPSKSASAATAQDTPTRDAQGRFTARSPQAAPSVEARARELYGQAETIKRATGIDVMEAFSADNTVKAKVINGEWDFTDVARHVTGRQGRTTPPPPARSPNDGRAQPSSVAKLTDTQFAKLDEELRNGKVYDLRL